MDYLLIAMCLALFFYPYELNMIPKSKVIRLESLQYNKTK